MNRKIAPFLVIFLLSLVINGQGRPVMESASLGVVSDGIEYLKRPGVFLSRLFASDDCDQTYGFLPCTTTVLGNIFLILVYGYLMFLSAKLLSDGSEILLQILGPGIIGGLFLPILSSLPDATIILASGLSGSTETAQSQVSVGMGLLAGSTIMLLTILWGTCLIVGKCDIVNSSAIDGKDTKCFSLTGSGVSTDIWTSYAARIMGISVIPFTIVLVFYTTTQSQVAILASFIVSICLLLSYCLYQVFQPRIQKRRIAYAMHKRVMSGILKQLKSRSIGKLINDEGKPNEAVIGRLFSKLDEDSNGSLSPKELRALVIGIDFEETDMDIDQAIALVFKDFDTTNDSGIDINEFVQGISAWITKALRHARLSNQDGSLTTRLVNDFHERTRQEQDLLKDQEDEVAATDVENAKFNTLKAVFMLLFGTVIAAVFADPLVDVVDNFSTATSIPTFFVSFIILPFASSSEVVSTLIFSSKKKKRTASLTYSEIYGSVTMGNILSLSVFLGLVYIRQLSWDFFSETLVIVIVCVAMGVIAGFRTTFPLWMSLLAFALYPLSLALVYVLDYVFGLS